MKLHWQRVRRARRLPAPLPPKPKRPLGPPVLFGFRDVSIRTRADVVNGFGSWEAFLDELVAFRSDPSTFEEGSLALRLVEGMVPPADLQAHRDDISRRIGAEWLKNFEAGAAALKEQMEPQWLSSLSRWFGRAA